MIIAMPNAKVKDVVPILDVHDVDRALRFYVDQLGFEIPLATAVRLFGCRSAHIANDAPIRYAELFSRLDRHAIG